MIKNFMLWFFQPSKLKVWDNYEKEESDSVHVVPRNDLIEHTLSDECVCGTTDEPIKRIDGSVGWLVNHHALDGRQ